VFEWDPRKAEADAAKHGVSFEDAVTVFLDPEALDGPDMQHSSAESRFLGLANPPADMCSWWRRRCGSDPNHQRAASEPPRTYGVRASD
jgi:hypothetical protein